MGIWQTLKRYWNRYEVSCGLSEYDKTVRISITDLWSQISEILYIENVREHLWDLIKKLEDDTSDVRLEYVNGLTYVLYIPRCCIKPLAAKLLEYVNTHID